MINISFLPEHIFNLNSFPVTNSLLVSWIAMAILIIFAYLSTRKMELVPKGAQNFIEIIIESLYNLITSVTSNDKESRRFFPLIATIFLFVLLSNWLGLIPGVGSVGIKEIGTDGAKIVPLFRAGSADLNFTMALAIISFFSIQYFGIISLGVFKYGKKFINFKTPILFFVGILETIGEVAKIISFSFRLFGNIFAGEVLLLVISFLAPFIVPLPFYFLEVIVGLIQAFIFSMLTLVFLKMAIVLHEEH
ncbi:F0F1 ATP synthase subunit A [Patescibacteria group bacterium]|nr:F0F1 ATP synthase subunit A [Patescibacteria group bacterium]MBU4000200.1 F0F1 ATP synthase subunit A [Patescibacteria group bacterium]MBU4056585.1 F0F1 ATP synthase subunit A [Patescibacteria group bacterium]MBU4368375.1 F0F1 ATP synthase subunit A [Patescibacteria group bacterium]